MIIMFTVLHILKGMEETSMHASSVIFYVFKNLVKLYFMIFAVTYLTPYDID